MPRLPYPVARPSVSLGAPLFATGPPANDLGEVESLFQGSETSIALLLLDQLKTSKRPGKPGDERALGSLIARPTGLEGGDTSPLLYACYGSERKPCGGPACFALQTGWDIFVSKVRTGTATRHSILRPLRSARHVPPSQAAMSGRAEVRHSPLIALSVHEVFPSAC